ncbi:MAG: heavy metal translocating P-type ATPase [Deltaproteobacteria bacterium]|jgi:Cd2+/Zn2+-exporting ATPase|nr:heavy metal translocating P-type ATPase [Deltaproteobacteria bacterium]
MHHTCSICGRTHPVGHPHLAASANLANHFVSLGSEGHTKDSVSDLDDGGEDGDPDSSQTCCPSCSEAAPVIPIKRPKTSACCPSCDEAAPLIPIKLVKSSACCSACEDSAPLVSVGTEVSEHSEGYGLMRLAGASALAIASEICHFTGLPEWVTITMAAVAAFLGGIPTWIAGWKSLFRFKLDIMALMSVAVTGAVLIGEFSEGALVLVLFALAEKLEERSVARARRAIASLLNLAPEKAFIASPDGSWAEVGASEVQAGTLVRVRPGEKLALDGRVVSGFSAIDQAPITGESLPIEKKAGDQVFAGTLNITGVLDYEVTVPYGDSALSRIVKTVAEAEESKAPVERFVERFARVYTPSVFLLAILAAVIPPLALSGQWSDWIYRALALLVIACPCALVVSTPVALLNALASATKRGLLVKGGIHLEEGRKLKVIALDKTGTLTKGRPSRTDFLSLGGYDRELAERLSGSLAALSNHPISTALAAASNFRSNPAPITDFVDRPGLGVMASFEGRPLALGSLSLMTELGMNTPELKEQFEKLRSEGKTVVAFSDGNTVAALIACADTVKEDSVRAISELKDLGIKTIMLTGDSEAAAAAVAAQVGLDGYRCNLMPDDKLAAIESLSAEGRVGMVGDGINDAPALARADIGFSMGAAGTGTAIETADVAIMDDNLAKIPAFIRLSRTVHRILIQNIIFILLIKIGFITVTLMGRTDMWMAVLADIGVTLLVITNSLRLTGQKNS